MAYPNFMGGPVNQNIMGPATGGGFQMPPGMLVQAGLNDIASGIYGRQGTALPEAQQVLAQQQFLRAQAQAKQAENAARRDRLERQETREEQKMRWEEEDRELRKQQAEQSAKLYGMMLGLGPQAGAGAGMGASAPGGGAITPQKYQRLGDQHIQLGLALGQAGVPGADDHMLAAKRMFDIAKGLREPKGEAGSFSYRSMVLNPNTPQALETPVRFPSKGGDPEYWDPDQGGWSTLTVPSERAAQRTLTGELTSGARTALEKQSTQRDFARDSLQALQARMNQAEGFAGLPGGIREMVSAVAEWADPRLAEELRNKKAEEVRTLARLTEGSLLPLLTGDTRFSDEDREIAREALRVLSVLSSDSQARKAVSDLMGVLENQSGTIAQKLGRSAPPPALQPGQTTQQEGWVYGVDENGRSWREPAR